jgi:hypothetical protein
MDAAHESSAENGSFEFFHSEDSIAKNSCQVPVARRRLFPPPGLTGNRQPATGFTGNRFKNWYSGNHYGGSNPVRDGPESPAD